MSKIKIKNSNFEDAIKLITSDRLNYGKNKIPINTDYEKGYVKGLEGAIFILKEAQRIMDEE